MTIHVNLSVASTIYDLETQIWTHDDFYQYGVDGYILLHNFFRD